MNKKKIKFNSKNEALFYIETLYKNDKDIMILIKWNLDVFQILKVYGHSSGKTQSPELPDLKT